MISFTPLVLHPPLLVQISMALDQPVLVLEQAVLESVVLELAVVAVLVLADLSEAGLVEGEPAVAGIAGHVVAVVDHL